MSRKQTFFSDDDYYILRNHIENFSKEICEYVKNNSGCSVLEVGPIGAYDQKQLLINYSKEIKDCCKEYNCSYHTLDIIEGTADYTGSIEDLSFLDKKFDVIILLSVLEHVKYIFNVPKHFYEHTKDNGILFINVPFLFKVHGPIPDYWRISTYGLDALFSKYFDLSFSTFPENEIGKNTMPLSINCIAKRKNNVL